eukprot:3777273-Prymnesium_polylepis.2
MVFSTRQPKARESARRARSAIVAQYTVHYGTPTHDAPAKCASVRGGSRPSAALDNGEVEMRQVVEASHRPLHRGRGSQGIQDAERRLLALEEGARALRVREVPRVPVDVPRGVEHPDEVAAVEDVRVVEDGQRHLVMKRPVRVVRAKPFLAVKDEHGAGALLLAHLGEQLRQQHLAVAVSEPNPGCRAT